MRTRKITTVFGAVVALILGAGTVTVFAAPPSGGFTPGDTLDPGCSPGDPDCTVNVGPNGATGTLQFNDGGVLGEMANVFYASSTNWLGIGTSSPTSLLTVAGTTTAAHFEATSTGITFPDGTTQVTAADQSAAGTTSGNIIQNATTDPTIDGVIKGALLEIRNPFGVHVSDKYAYVTGSENDGFTVIDISNPSDPVIASFSIGNNTLLDGPRGLDVAGKYAYVVSANSDSFTSIDISNPSDPVIKGAIVGDSTNLDHANHVQVSGNYAYATANNSFVVIDISDPTDPVVTGAITGDHLHFDGSREVDIAGKYAYVVGSRSITSIDISDPSNPTVEGAITNDSTNLGGASGVDVRGRYAYVASRFSDSLTIVDISDPSNLVVEGAITGDTTNLRGAFSVHVSGRYAIVTGRESHSLAVVDVSDPSNPTIASAIIDDSNLEGAHGLHVSGKRAYVTGLTNHSFTVVNIPGIDAAAASIGSVQTDSLNVSGDGIIQDLMVENGLNVGERGIRSDGQISVGTSTGTSTFEGNLRVKGTLDSSDISFANDFLLTERFMSEDGYAAPTSSVRELQLFSHEDRKIFGVDERGTLTLGGPHGTSTIRSGVASTSNLAGGLSLGGPLTVASSTGTSTATSTFGGGLTVSGLTDITDALSVSGSGTFDQSLSVGGMGTFSSAVRTTNPATASEFAGDVTVGGDLSVDGTTTAITGDLTVADDLTVGTTSTTTATATIHQHLEATASTTLAHLTTDHIDLTDGYNLAVGTTSGSSTLTIDTPETSDALAISESGNLGVGTTSPEYKVDAPAGAIRAKAFVNASEKGKKTDIHSFGERDYDSLMDTINDIEINSYRYKSDASSTTRLGLIAEDAPETLLSQYGDGVDLYKLSTAAIGGVKIHEKQLAELDERVARLDTKISDIASSTESRINESNNFTSNVQAVFESFGHRVQDGMMFVQDMTVGSLTVGSETKPTEITVYDQHGKAGCLTVNDVDNGEVTVSSGKCGSDTSRVTAPSDSENTNDSHDDTPEKGSTTSTSSTQQSSSTTESTSSAPTASQGTSSSDTATTSAPSTSNGNDANDSSDDPQDTTTASTTTSSSGTGTEEGSSTKKESSSSHNPSSSEKSEQGTQTQSTDGSSSASGDTSKNDNPSPQTESPDGSHGTSTDSASA